MLAVRRLFQQRPLLGNAIAYGTLFVGAEFTQQTLLNRVLVSLPNSPCRIDSRELPIDDAPDLNPFQFPEGTVELNFG